jgi:osmotically-inducible protein OsmY
MAKNRRTTRSSIGQASAKTGALVGAAGLGAVIEYFVLDREHAARRRHTARDRAVATMRRRSRDAVRRAKYMEGVAEGVAHKAVHAVPGVQREREVPDDVTLAQRVESSAFRRARVPKQHVSVNAENGVVYLRGQLDSEDQIDALVHSAHGVEGVKEVKNLLHIPDGNPAA